MTSAAALIATWSEASALSSLLGATVTRQTMRCEMAETVESRAHSSMRSSMMSPAGWTLVRPPMAWETRREV